MKHRDPMPTGHHVLIKLKKVEVKVGSIIIAQGDSTTEKNIQRGSEEAYVMECGINAFKAFDGGEPWCKVGDLVLIPKYAGKPISGVDDDEIYQVINDEDVLVVFRKEGLCNE